MEGYRLLCRRGVTSSTLEKFQSRAPTLEFFQSHWPPSSANARGYAICVCHDFAEQALTIESDCRQAPVRDAESPARAGRSAPCRYAETARARSCPCRCPASGFGASPPVSQVSALSDVVSRLFENSSSSLVLVAQPVGARLTLDYISPPRRRGRAGRTYFSTARRNSS